jgi:hypothetical protein
MRNQNKKIPKLKKELFHFSFKKMSTFSAEQAKMLARLRIEENDGLTLAEFENGLEAYMSESRATAKTRRRNVLAARKLFSGYRFKEREQKPPVDLMPRRKVKSQVVVPPG